MPRSFVHLGQLAELVEQAAKEISKTVGRGPRQREDHLGRFWLVRTAGSRDVQRSAADWCYAFIALGLARPARDAHAFSKRTSTFAHDWKRAKQRLPAVR